MQLAIDLRCCQTGSAIRGIGRYSFYLAEELTGIVKKVDYICDYNRKTHFPRAHSANSIIAETELTADVFYHQSSNFEPELPVLDPRLLKAKLKSVTVYDLIPFVMREHYLDGADENSINSARHYFNQLNNLKHFDLIFVISESTKNDVIKHLGLKPKQVTNISGSCDDFFRSPLHHKVKKQEVFGRFGISMPYFMYTTSNDYRKNNKMAIAGFARACQTIGYEHQLVLVSSHFDEALTTQLFEFAAECGMQDRQLVVLFRVSDDELKLLYTNAYCSYFPSLYEGFGLPILEAMCCNSAVIASNTSSMPELVGYSEQLFDPTNVCSIADMVARVVMNPQWRNLIAERGLQRASSFNWRASAERVIAAYSQQKSDRACT
jgi:glycosyltransferase involved in cell wall biosynthesis